MHEKSVTSHIKATFLCRWKTLWFDYKVVGHKNSVSLMGSRMVKPEDVLESLMNDGTIDAIRLKIINQLKANVSIWMNNFLVYAISLY